ncbi:beta-scruin [Caerostris darwini]|uniref:Beta-scruin n=1 Tax=Caerostris darwini TaxID=1538125 RepID=A0AAV4PG42_9ARAC|nr:beta-scruin [Caerostris darwini]
MRKAPALKGKAKRSSSKLCRNGKIPSFTNVGEEPLQPQWEPEIIDSRDALAGMVANVPKGQIKEKGNKDYYSDEDAALENEEEHAQANLRNAGSDEELYRAIVVVGGFNAKEAYEQEPDVQKTKRRSSCCASSKDNGSSMLLYDPASDQWSVIGQLPKPRHHHRLIYLKNVLYTIGGCDPEVTKQGKMVPLRSGHSFDLASKKWRKLPKMRHSRMYHGTAALQGKIYVVGGKDETDNMLDSVEVYDPEKNAWYELNSHLDSPSMGVGVCTHGGQLWVIGGMVQSKAGKIDLVKDVKRYDPNNQSWNHDIPDIPFPRAFIGAVECGKRLYVIGGTSYADIDIYSEELNSLDDVLVYEDVKRKWQASVPMPSPRHFVATATVGRSIFVLGGLTSFKKEALDEVILFTENTKQWHPCSTLPVPLCGFATASVPSIIENK